jgi:hypothetical protein
MPLPIRITPDLTVALGGAAVTISPAQGMRLAEQLIRRSTRKMMVEEALAAPAMPRRRRPEPARSARRSH